MTTAAQLRSGKGAGDENFPVASWLIRRRHRGVILAFYEFVRSADDIADHASLAPADKLARLDDLERSLLDQGGNEPEGLALGKMLRARGLPTRHAQDLLKAFRQDVTKLRYADWADLIDYCSRSAMPVGRFVLDVHGEPHTTWPASDALCAALQIINHLQDCGDDYRKLDRVYIPLDALALNGIGVDALVQSPASPALRNCLQALAGRTTALLQEGAALSTQVNDSRLALEIAAIHSLASRLVTMLCRRDPLSDRVHLGKAAAVAVGGAGAARVLLQRMLGAAPRLRRLQVP